MKSLSVIVLFVLFAGTEILANPDSAYFKANAFYQEGRYEEAIEIYESIVNEGLTSEFLYYNLGNAYFRSNKLGKARLYYEKSLKINPANEDSQANIKYLEGLLIDRFEVMPEFFFRKWMQNLLSGFSVDQWAIFSMVSFFLCISSILVYLLLRQIIFRKIGFYSSLIFFIISMFSLFASSKQNQILLSPDSAVVIDLSVNARSSPRDTGNSLFILHEGAKVGLGDKTGGWQEIQLSDGRKAWVPQESIEAI